MKYQLQTERQPEEIKAATKLQALQRGKHLRNDMKAGRGKFTGRGGRGRGRGGGRGGRGGGRRSWTRYVPAGSWRCWTWYAGARHAPAGPWGCWTWYAGAGYAPAGPWGAGRGATWGAWAPRGLPNRRGATGGLPVGVCLEGYPNQKYSWCNQLQNQLQNQHLQRHQKQHP